MTWGIRRDWRGFVAAEIVKETAKQIRYVHPTWGETRTDKHNFMDWRGNEETARTLCAKLNSAQAEYSRRSNAASAWFAARKAEIFASCDTHPKGGDSTEIEVPFMRGAVGSEADETPKG